MKKVIAVILLSAALVLTFSACTANNSVTEEPPLDSRIGNLLNFGGIDWRILDIQNGEALIISEDILFVLPYHSQRTEIKWGYSDLRAYLNGEFYETTFSAEERERIIETTNDSSRLYPSSEHITTDKIFLLSLRELDYYLIDRKSVPLNNFNSWWLRSPGASSGVAIVCSFDDRGKFFTGSLFVDEAHGVRPALWLKLDLDNILYESSPMQTDYEKIFHDYLVAREWQNERIERADGTVIDLSNFELDGWNIFDLNGDGILVMLFRVTDFADDGGNPSLGESEHLRSHVYFFCIIENYEVKPLLNTYRFETPIGHSGGTLIRILYDTVTQTHVVVEHFNHFVSAASRGNERQLKSYIYSNGVLTEGVVTRELMETIGFVKSEFGDNTDFFYQPRYPSGLKYDGDFNEEDIVIIYLIDGILVPWETYNNRLIAPLNSDFVLGYG